MLENLPYVVVRNPRGEKSDDCGQAAAAAAATTAAVLQEEEPWILVNDDMTPASFETPSPPMGPAEPTKSPGTIPQMMGLHGHLSSFDVQELSCEEAGSIHSGLDKEYSRFCRVTMQGPEDYRTIRLEPDVILCRPAEAWHSGRWKPPAGSTWSFSFALAVEKSVNCFVNVGLVEWVAPRKDAEDRPCQAASATAADERSLADVMKVKSVAEEEMPEGWIADQHVDENPRQMMLGCRKGVQWFGNSAKYPLFQDSITPGSLLRFRCDYHLNREGDIVQVKIWLLASPVKFEYGGDYTVKEADLWCEPLAQWWAPRWSRQDKKTRSLWVPAITLYTKEDFVTVAWQSP
mmetsp:Transcript_26475/g.61507  ORF Transcript_26475/g.61507 Transcript_26475/m.61507 type:complete len:347 (+) Transcript_26475:47-1087(+)